MEGFRQKEIIKVQAEEVKSGIKIQTKYTQEDIKTEGVIKRSKALADVSSKKEMQKTTLSFTTENDVILQKECFGEPIKGRLPIKILRAILFHHYDDMERKVLYIRIKPDGGEETVLYWDVQKNENRWIKKVFETNGIYFGFGEKKETEIKRKLLLTVLNKAERMVLAERHGWYKEGEKWQYAFPEELTWREVDQKC